MTNTKREAQIAPRMEQSSSLHHSSADCKSMILGRSPEQSAASPCPEYSGTEGTTGAGPVATGRYGPSTTPVSVATKDHAGRSGVCMQRGEAKGV